MKQDGSLENNADIEFDIISFFPYETRVFYKFVSQSVAEVYEKEYQIKPYEWRTLAILGLNNVMTSTDLIERSSMDKVSVSRAISSLQKRGWLLSKVNTQDRRSRLVWTSEEGRRVFCDLIPKMKAVEAHILADLSDKERAELRHLMTKIQNRIMSSKDQAYLNVTKLNTQEEITSP